MRCPQELRIRGTFFSIELCIIICTFIFVSFLNDIVQHIPDDTNVDELIKRLDGSTLDGRAIHIERYTYYLYYGIIFIF